MAAVRAAYAAAVAEKAFDAKINGFDATVNENSDDGNNKCNDYVYVVVVPKPLEGLFCVVDFGKRFREFV